MNKALKIILAIVVLIVIVAATTITQLLYYDWGEEDEKEDDTSKLFCNFWKKKNWSVPYNITQKEKRPLYLYLTMREFLAKRFWYDGYMKCCRTLNMTCKKAEVTGSSRYGILINLNNTGDWRMINFNKNKSRGVYNYLHYRYEFNPIKGRYEAKYI